MSNLNIYIADLYNVKEAISRDRRASSAARCKCTDPQLLKRQKLLFCISFLTILKGNPNEEKSNSLYKPLYG